ncbi:MAG: AI-2E family transporter, partial [Lentisphaeria bacterium]|nr:AI-2E family transporter [Lentisphaeria bacterium]
GVLLGLISSTTVLLPVLGLAGCITLSCCVCIAFCEGHLAATLLGVLCVYLLVNGILEQLILYPNLVGGSIGLTILETIIVVLLGGLFAGIPGMIFAVPAAAVIKSMIPKIYRIWSAPPEGKKT